MTIFTKHAFFINIPYINKILKLCCGYVSLTHSFVCIWLILSRVIICHEALFISGKEAEFGDSREEICSISSDKGPESSETGTRSEWLFSIKQDTEDAKPVVSLPHTENHYQLQRANQHISSVRIAFSFVLLVKTGARSRVWAKEDSVWHLFCRTGEQQVQAGTGIMGVL